MPRRHSPPPRPLPSLIKEIHALIDHRWQTADKYFQVSIEFDSIFPKHKIAIAKHFASLGLDWKLLIESRGFQKVKDKGKSMTFLCTKMDKRNNDTL